MDLGIIPGTEIQVQKVARLRPVEIKFKGYNYRCVERSGKYSC
jgi:Fe2+ transport system protein FeoA